MSVADDPQTPKTPRTVELVVDGVIDHDDEPRLCGQVQALLASGKVDIIICDIGDLTSRDAVAVAVLARMQLTAQRLGGSIRLRRVAPELRGLLSFCGLRNVVRREMIGPLHPEDG